MGLFPALRNTPGGFTFGDGLVPQIWFCCALLTCVYPNKISLLVLLGVAGVFDFWWRLPIVTPSIYFQALISTQILLTAVHLFLRRASFRISPAEFIETFRTSALGLLVALFFVAGFHKFTWQARVEAGAFFRLIAGYYAPFLHLSRISSLAIWLLTAGGELLIAIGLLFQRTRGAALLSCLAFACFVGSVVYGFGAAVLAVWGVLGSCFLF